MKVELNQLTAGRATTRSVFAILPEDRETPANLTVADVKELMLGCNVAHDRVHYLAADIDRLEQLLAKAETRMKNLETIIALTPEDLDEE